MKLQYWLCPKADKTKGVVKLSVSVSGKESQFSTKVEVQVTDWQARGSIVRSTDPKHAYKNSVLASIRARAEDVEKLLRQKRMKFEAATITDVLKNIAQKPYTGDSPFFEELAESDVLAPILKKKEAEKLTMTKCLENLKTYKKRLSENTYGNYRTYQSKMREFLAYIEKPNLAAADFSPEIAVELIDFMQEADLEPSYIKVVVNHYQHALKQAKKRGLIPYNPLVDFEYEAAKQYNYVYLTSAELTQLLFLQGLSDKLEKIRDAFRFMCFTSLHYTDYNSLSSTDVTRSSDGLSFWLEKRRDKSSIEYCQKMHPFALQIISKYGIIENLPRFKYRTMHRGIAEICRIAGINKNITPKAGRKTFAYICLNVWSYSLETTAKMMGLNKTDTIAYYAKVGRERVDREVNWNTM